MKSTITPRQFAGIIGGALLLVGVLALLIIPVSGDYESGMFGDQSVKCGSAVVAETDMYSGRPLAACRDALGTRRAWGWPVFALGAVAVVGAVFVRPAQGTRSRTGNREEGTTTV